jgi:hygromycin-B 7''-O-kinase
VSATPDVSATIVGMELAPLDDLDAWGPRIAEALARHGLAEETEPEPGYNATYPTFVVGDVVVKLFGHHPSWRTSLTAERGALALVATDPEILAPRLLAEGSTDDGWPYLVTTRLPGAAAWPHLQPAEHWPTIARELGEQIRRLHTLPPSGVATDADWPGVDVVAAVTRSSLPAHLVAQVEDYVAALPPFDEVFVHLDLAGQHVFVDDGHVTGLIDWGDALVTDRHAELIQIYRDTLDCGPDLFRTFLEATDWPVGPDFPRLALGHALRRQGLMLAQHPSGDVFMQIAEKLPLEDIATLDELALELFGSV